MGGGICGSYYVSAGEVADHSADNADFLADVMNDMGYTLDGMTAARRDAWLRECAANLDGDGEGALRAILSALDAVDASSTEGA